MATKAQKAKQAGIEKMTELFGEPDRWGNFKMVVRGEQRRIKVQKNSWRYETKYSFGWSKSAGAHFTTPASMDLIESIYKGTKL